MPGQNVVSSNVPAWLVVVVLGLKVVKAGSKGVVVVVVGLNVVVVVGRTDVVVVVVVLLVEASSSVQPTKGSPLLPASRISLRP